MGRLKQWEELICTFDPFGENFPMYTFRHCCIEKEGFETD